MEEEDQQTAESENTILLEPYQYVCNLSGNQIRSQLIKAFTQWLPLPADKLAIINDLIEMIHNASILIDDIEDNSKLRCGVPAAHHIYGTPLTINAANYMYFLAMQKALTLNHSNVAEIFIEQMLQFHQGQGMEIWWRDNFVSPSEDEYRQMVIKKCGSLLNLGFRLMVLFSSPEKTGKLNFNPLCQLLSLFFQIRDDYCNLLPDCTTTNKSFCEDLTEGKFSFPILHAVNSREADTRLIHILKQRTQNVELKQYCIHLLHEFGSMEYTRQVCENLSKQILDEIDRLGGNTCLKRLIQNMSQVFSQNRNEKSSKTQNNDETKKKKSTIINGQHHKSDDTIEIDILKSK